MALARRFQDLPTEVIENIAKYLDDRSLAALSCASTSLRTILTDPSSLLWSYKFNQLYDVSDKKTNARLCAIYKARAVVLRRGANFTTGYSSSEKKCTRLIVQLIVESKSSNASVGNQASRTSRNVATIKGLAQDWRLFHNIAVAKYPIKDSEKVLTAVRVALSFLLFNESMSLPSHGLRYCQEMVYQNARKEPLFRGASRDQVNMPWILSALNMFKNYMMREPSHSVHQAFQELGSAQRPRCWDEPIKADGAYKVGTNWKGNFAFLDSDELDWIRDGTSQQWLEDKFYDEFSDLFLDFPEVQTSLAWPEFLETILVSKTHPSLRKIRRDQQAKSTRAEPATASGTRTLRSRPPKASKASPPAPLGPVTRKRKASNESAEKGRVTRKRKVNSSSDKDDAMAIYIESPPASASSEASSPASEDLDMFELPAQQPIDPGALQFKGYGQENDRFFSTGWLTPLPSQGYLPGWMRFTMVKVLCSGISEENLPKPNDEASFRRLVSEISFGEHVWAYEGVVLPGGKMIIGRWWAPEVDDPTAGTGIGTVPAGDGVSLYSGPFMYWCVDGEEEDEEGESDDEH